MTQQELTNNVDAQQVLVSARASLASGWALRGSMLDRAREILDHAQAYLAAQVEAAEVEKVDEPRLCSSCETNEVMIGGYSRCYECENEHEEAKRARPALPTVEQIADAAKAFTWERYEAGERKRLLGYVVYKVPEFPELSVYVVPTGQRTTRRRDSLRAQFEISGKRVSRAAFAVKLAELAGGSQ
jgi:hypothetical protein